MDDSLFGFLLQECGVGVFSSPVPLLAICHLSPTSVLHEQEDNTAYRPASCSRESYHIPICVSHISLAV